MIYKNDDPMAVLAMERDRTGNYGNDYDIGFIDPEQICPECGTLYPDYFYYNDNDELIGCDHCIRREATN